MAPKIDPDTGKPVDNNDVDDDDTNDDQPSLTQKQFSDGVTAAVAKAQRKAAKEARAAMEADLGMSLDEAKALREKNADAESAKLSEVEKREKEAEAREAAAVAREADAAKTMFNMKAELALRDADLVNAKKASKYVKLLELEPDADDEALAEAIAALKEEMPELFTAEGDDDQDDQGAGPGRSGVPGRGNQKPPKDPLPKATGFDAGKARYESRTANSGSSVLERMQGKTS